MNPEQNKTVLVTGGRGFIGRAVVKLLQRSGYRVVSLDRTPVDGATESPGCKQIESDLADETGWKPVFEREEVTGIVHLAAILPTAAQRDPQMATRVNVDSSLRLIEAARMFCVKRFVFASSLSVYGTYPDDQVVSESSRCAPEDIYGAGKVYVEQLGKSYHDLYGLDFVSLRIGRVVGPGAHSTSSAWRSEIFERLRADRSVEIDLPYKESERLLTTHVEDVARMLSMLVSAPRLDYCVYNAVCESVVVDELKREVERLNPRVRVRLGGGAVVGNPRRLDSSRFAQEFDFRVAPIFEQLAAAATDR